MIFSLSKEKLAQIGLAGKSRVSRTLTGFTPPLSSSSISYRFSLRTWQTAIMRMNNASTAAATSMAINMRASPLRNSILRTITPQVDHRHKTRHPKRVGGNRRKLD
ncbi:hypothetical protein COV40_02155 [Candidatus Berkelbacteria bacterium CG11_big_fil_rev_8_21_14_0_20_42_15]|uniref:Uncharacterized protein n=1 Tax=Candidatus Berkelbacteria bacterium CG11_big_fil_rev_8_21_14_0_20_42_15 TaxID=1974517 RepID=A0A2H0PYR7_9BACT|nr:MAG: hypothetical protein COV40_02155 [Candidatus Berkelbacteria bacterium CG11_big_fil_rev_8_21_14_0_20_42_15]